MKVCGILWIFMNNYSWLCMVIYDSLPRFMEIHGNFSIAKSMNQHPATFRSAIFRLNFGLGRSSKRASLLWMWFLDLIWKNHDVILRTF